MITTEPDAKKKWCPFVRAGMYGEGDAAIRMIPVNRDARQEPPEELAPCLGSGCMAWRWKDPEAASTHGGTALGDLKSGRRGFCGLAGYPVV